MPTYQYACTEPSCANRFELVQSFTDPAVTECPVCAGRVRKVYGSVGVVFKGSGFYRTDSRDAANGGVAAKSESAKSDSAKGDGAKGESAKGESAKSNGTSDSKSESSSAGKSESSSSTPAASGSGSSGSSSAGKAAASA